MSVEQYISTLTGPRLSATLHNVQDDNVSAAIPKFKGTYSLAMHDVLKGMGITDAFDGDLANFTKLGYSPWGNLYIGGVTHKTFISVDAHGTKAIALNGLMITVVSPQKYVYLDRPFVYMLIDCETNLPFFIGTVLDL
jgi:serpin B